MIPFQTWLSQIVGYCHFVADAVGVRRAWINEDYSKTSVTNFDELYEQLFDDLDSDSLEREMIANLPDFQAREALSDFLQQIRVIDFRREHDRGLSATVDLLDSEEWDRLVQIARRVERHLPFPGEGRIESSVQ